MLDQSNQNDEHGTGEAGNLSEAIIGHAAISALASAALDQSPISGWSNGHCPILEAG
jgi:hypothetical protein